MNSTFKTSSTQNDYSKCPWVTYIVIFVAFYLLTPYDILWTIKDKAIIEQYISSVREGSVIRRVALLTLGIIAVLAFFNKKMGNKLQINGSLGWLCIFFMAWSSLSCLWAYNIGLTIRRLGVFAILCLVALAIARQFSINRVVAFFYYCSAFTLLISIISEIALNTFRPFHLDYRFAGVVHPIGQGFNCAVLFISGIFYAKMARHGRYLHFGVTLIAVCFLILTGSRTPFIGALVAIALCWIIGTPKKQMGFSFSIMASLIPILFLGLYFTLDEKLFSYFHVGVSLGRDPLTEATFTGRIPLWKELIEYVVQNPFLGYGYDSFWTPSHLSLVSSNQGWVIGTSHSGYLETALGLGLIGLMAYVLILVTAIKRSINTYFKSGQIGYLFITAILMWVLINSLSACILFNTNFQSFLCMILLVKLAFVEKWQPSKNKK